MVKFNQAINKDTVTATTVKAQDKDGNDLASTLEVVNGDTVAIMLTIPLSQSQQIKVIATSGVKTADEKASAEYNSGLITMADTTLPVVTEAKAINAKQVQLTFNEPVNFAAPSPQLLNNVKIGGVAVIAKVTPNFANNTVMLEFGSNLKSGTQTLEIADIADFAGYKTIKKSFDILVAEDVAAPQITKAEMINKGTVRVTFNEKADTVGNFKINNVDILPQNVTAVTNSNGTQFDIAYTLDLSAVVEVKVQYKGQKDVVGNEVKDWTNMTFSIKDDTAFPTVINQLGTANKLTLTFSKTMNTQTGTVKVLDKDKKEIKSLNVSALTFKANTNNTVIELTGTDIGLDSVDPSDYTINIKGMKDASIRENLLPEQNIAIKSVDTKKATITSTYFIQNGTKTGADLGKDDTITFFFSEAMDADTLKNLSNYVENTVGALSAKDGVVVKSVGADGKSIVITYPQARNLTSTFTVYAIKDLAGNMMVSNNLVAKNNSTGIAVTAVEAPKKNEVVVTFNSAVKSVDPSTIKVQYNNVDYASPINAVIDATNSNKVTFTLSKDLGTDAANYKVVANNYNLVQNIYGSTFADATGINNVIADKVSPQLVSVKNDVANTNKILVKFSENINLAANFKYDLKVVDLTTNTELAPDTDFTLASATDTVTITVIKPGVTSHKVSVQLLNGRFITDGAANTTLKFDATTVTDASNTEAVITEKTNPLIANTALAGDVVTLTFNEEMDTTLLDAKEEISALVVKTLDDATTRTLTVANNSDIVWSSDKKTLTITLGAGHAIVATDKITTANLKDAAGNLIDVAGSTDTAF